MKITIKTNEYDKGGNLKAFITLIIDDTIFCEGFKVMEGKKGIFLAKPQLKNGDNYKDVTFFKNEISKIILDNYKVGEEVTLIVDTDTMNYTIETDDFPFE